MATTIREFIDGNSLEQDLYVYPYVRGSVNLPCVLVMPGGNGRNNEAGDPTLAMARGTEKWSFQLIVLCSRTDEDSGQELLDLFLDKQGELSIRQAIWQNPSLGVDDVDAMVTGIVEYHGSYDMVSTRHVGAAVLVQVHAF